ncbi:hypothetical protein C8J56DRAFT_818039 [Mycena floridula]|nr:hypothetical protein C8J56DRAFT_818039 [Mycena floridula]
MSAAPPPKPRVPERYLDAPAQRLYILAVGAACQAVKLLDFFRQFAATDQSFCMKWIFVDLIYCVSLAWLRIPRLRYSVSVVLLQIVSLAFLDGLMFGGISVNMSGLLWQSRADAASRSEPFSLLNFISPLLGSSESSQSDGHLLGQHTIRMSPISTAQLNPAQLTFCLAASSGPVLVPVLLNNTNPSSLRYSITPLGAVKDGHDEAEYFDLTTRDIKAIENARLDALQLARPASSSSPDSEEYDEYDDDDDDDDDKTTSESQQPFSNLQRTQSLVHIRISKPGKVKLERVLDSSVEARIRYPSEITVGPCPTVTFVEDSTSKENIRCAGQDLEAQLMIDISGVPPLSLRWFRTMSGRRESYLVEGIESSDVQKVRPGVPQKIRVPLAVSLAAVGEYVYALEEVMDSLGNIVSIAARPETAASTTRIFQVLRRPTMSFKHCAAGHPTSILIGAEAALTMSANDVDPLDMPLQVVLKFQPPNSSDIEDSGAKRSKAWKKTLSTQGNSKDLIVRASTPGEYTIASVKGKWCEGDVLSPEVCKVVERPRPSAEIEWKKIHECSGDTGVSASLVLRGTPPFHVHYRIQRDNEAPVERSETFSTSRGDVTLQPDRSGHYTFSFFRISDAYYAVDLSGPSIDQVIHPLASADFASSGRTAGRNRKLISNCEGSTINVDVDLKGTGPWTLEVQTVGPRASETIIIPDIQTSRKTLQIPIPKKVDEDGGTFEIDLVSVEDKYKCKRTLSVPGLSVNVKRVKPTARFYGDKRHINTLENQQVELPLRLTGDGPWRVRYRRKEAEDIVHKATLTSPNDHLKVRDSGLYEIIDISDSQCPGTVVAEASTYLVDWIPRPSAKLSQKTKADYEVKNGSYILPPICENSDDYVDLDLEGRPPFEIMYNIAQDNENGGTRLLGQPTFNSIQRYSRFQLQTSHPGRIYYEVKQIGDGSYPLGKYKDAIIPRSERLLFEQQVSVLPSARFKTRNRLSYCLQDEFVPLDPLSSDGVVMFQGTPPFRVRLSINNIISRSAETVTLETRENVWKLNIPSYKFTSVGPHRIKIDSVSDASACSHAELDPLATLIWVDVAETAAIVPFDRRDDFCVGEVAQFQLEGIPPWTIGYRVNGKSYTQEAKTSPFALQQQIPGEFTITSIAQQQKLCKAVVTDLKFSVHPLPSAQVGHGKRIYQDINEGDQAEIVFTLVGEPPFTFTYQRSEASPRKGGKPGKVLETHTVSRIFSKEYSIYSALEGTWTITSISDKFCRYPPAQPETEKGR